MKDFYDFTKMKRVPHPMQHRIDSGELKLVNYMDIPDEEFNANIKLLDEDQREYALERRKQWQEEKLLQEISQAEISCGSQLPTEIIDLLEKIKIHLSSVGVR